MLTHTLSSLLNFLLGCLHLGHYLASEICPYSIAIMSADARNLPVVMTEGICMQP